MVFGPSNLPPIDPFQHGRRPVVGEKVNIDFGDSITAHPEVTGIVEFISDEHITVAYGVTTKRFRLDQCMAIDVIDN